ncbi:aspartyl/asparaginyl beta-hydroxylase domain-containing protein [Xanthomonas sp. XNM01]|uniref:aspartyl/asparaginyl beta-hydroxylase domain-containing protein n=1 Tax=Xanthomonas sp. XNM01 TaxID=2769289 RepID=UPI00178667C9|nr:aspartyl/asparaginyl beta-hydroxylase domain-containing protein [Xanthomonas sp. XNM01]MBD9367249.1 aspartyl/asparaginyl beta-hydroxylase domain-containing protein [Xanthomonas sp. XNM01]
MLVDDRVETLVSAAAAAVAGGRWSEAEHLWGQVRAREPDNTQALYSLGVHAYRRGDHAAALELLHAARRGAPSDPMLLLTIGVVHRDRGEDALEWEAIMAALAADPYFLPALLAKAECLERVRGSAVAASVFRDALRVAPAEPHWPPALRRRLAHASDVVRRDTDDLFDYLHGRLANERTGVEAALDGRWAEAVSILSGRSRPYRSECNQLHIPRLPALTFYDPALFPWIPSLEARTTDIRAELACLVAERFDAFVPYIAYRPGDPVNQWTALNHSRNWSSFHLWAHGEPVQDNLARCPATAEALAGLDAVRIAGLCPNAMFSALAPRTHIPPHTGETNARLVAHLPLVVPNGCTLRVGNDRRSWQEGRVMVFDDTIEHEARNDSDALRVVLIFDVWNPLLSLEERAMVETLASAMREYREGRESGDGR